ncbi:MAG: phasin family protein [Bacillota bacterium]
MLDLFKKTLATGLGAMLFTKDKVQELVDELVKQGRLNQQEAEAIIDDLVAMVEEETENRRQKIKETIDQIDFKNDQEITELKDKVRDLELEIKALQEEIKELQNSNQSSDSITEIGE